MSMPGQQWCQYIVYLMYAISIPLIVNSIKLIVKEMIKEFQNPEDD